MARVTDMKYGEYYLDGFEEGEPIFILRGRDRAALFTLASYEQKCVQLGSPDEHIEGIGLVRLNFAEWQENNETKVPD